MKKTLITLSLTLLVTLIPIFALSETIDVAIKGFDDGTKTNRQHDFREAVMNAKLQAIERAGVEIQSITRVENFQLKFNMAESKARAVLLPGFKVLDIGYQTDGTYQVVLVGKVLSKLASGKKPLVSPRTFTNSIGMKFMLLPAGTFMMGSPSDEPGRLDREKQHRVTLSKGFYMHTTEVTVGQWRTFIQDTGFRTDAENKGGAWIWTGKKWEKKAGYYWDNPGFSQGEENPVTCVSWNDVQEFIRWLSRKEGKTYRLPTEAEWEYACRAGSTTAFSSGGITELKCGHDPNLDAMGWYCGNSGKKTHPVAQKNPNAWGLYDMHGNVFEWCQDCYEEKYSFGQVSDPKGPSSGKYRVFRGGGWSNDARFCRSANRPGFNPDYRNHCLGFRVARDF